MSETVKNEAAAPIPAASATDPFQAVAAIYDNLQTNLNMMLAACKTRAERDSILQQFVTARHNYDDCLNQQFQANDAALAVLVVKANQSAAEIQAIDKQLGNIVKVLRIVSTAVDYGTQIAKKIVAI